MKRTDSKLAFLPLLALLLAACASTPQPAARASSGITFIHMNDTYRVADVEDGTRGGFGRVVNTIRALQAEGREVHVLHGGDLLSPSLESQIWFGGQMVEALNFIDALAPTYFIAGNHEFDIRDGDLAYFINAMRSSEFDWMGDNYSFTLATRSLTVAKNRFHFYGRRQNNRRVLGNIASGRRWHRARLR